jgi:hypothetical protein
MVTSSSRFLAGQIMDKNFMTAIYRSKQTVFTLRDLSVILGKKNYDNLKRTVNYYIKKGVLHNLRRGFYMKDDFDPFELAVKIYPPAYIGFETVLFKEGVIFQYNPTIAVASYLSREIEVGTYLFKYTKLKGTVLSSPEGLVFKDFYVLAGKERAFLDILYLNKDFYVDHAARLNKKRLLAIVKIYDNHSLEKKVKELFNA